MTKPQLSLIIEGLKPGDEVDVTDLMPPVHSAQLYLWGKVLGVPISTRVTDGRVFVRLKGTMTQIMDALATEIPQ